MHGWVSEIASIISKMMDGNSDLNVVQSHRLGEACAHIAAILSCLVRATQMRQKSGVDSCTSQLCTWLPTSHQVRIWFAYYLH